MIINVIDEYYSTAYIATVTTTGTPTSTNETTTTVTSNIIIIKPQAVSSKGEDTLIVKSAEVLVKPDTEFNVKITVLFKHA